MTTGSGRTLHDSLTNTFQVMPSRTVVPITPIPHTGNHATSGANYDSRSTIIPLGKIGYPNEGKRI